MPSYLYSRRPIRKYRDGSIHYGNALISLRSIRTANEPMSYLDSHPMTTRRDSFKAVGARRQPGLTHHIYRSCYLPPDVEKLNNRKIRELRIMNNSLPWKQRERSTRQRALRHHQPFKANAQRRNICSDSYRRTMVTPEIAIATSAQWRNPSAQRTCVHIFSSAPTAMPAEDDESTVNRKPSQKLPCSCAQPL